LDQGGGVSNPQVCRLLGLPARTGRNFMARFKAECGDRLVCRGSQVRWRAGEQQGGIGGGGGKFSY
jgi:hypothetical protein